MKVKRREFITLIGAGAAWPLAARAQQAGKPPTIGFLGTDASVWRPWTAAFVGRLRELGWIEAIEYRWLRPILPPSDSNSCARLSPVSVDWQSC